MNLELKVPPVVVMFVCMILMYLVSKIFSSFNLDFMFQIFISVETFFSALFLIGAGAYVFSDKETTINPHKPKETTFLVTTGIYKFTRNPMYLGIVTILFSFLIYLGNPINIVNIVLFILYMNKFQIIPEEKALEDLFKEDYIEYKSKVRRWM